MCVDFLGQTKLSKPQQRDARIAAMQQGGGGGEAKGNVKPDMSVPDRYYTKDEYRALSATQELGLKRKRESRGHRPGKKPKTTAGGFDDHTIKALAALVGKINEVGKDDDKSDGDANNNQNDENNRTNPATNRG